MDSINITQLCYETDKSHCAEGQCFLSAKFSEKELVFEFEKTTVIYEATGNSKFSGEDFPYSFIPKGSQLLKINIKNYGSRASFGLKTLEGYTSYYCTSVQLKSNDIEENCTYDEIHIPRLDYSTLQNKKKIN
jgi:hypothetical protein